MRIHEAIRDEYELGALFLEEVTQFRKTWATFHPVLPISHSELSMLGVVAQLCEKDGEPVTVSRIADFMKQSRPGVSQKLSLLEQEGLVERVEDKDDRRISHIALTEKGTQLAESAFREFLGRVESALHLMGENKVRDLLELLEDLRVALETTQQAQKEKE